MQRIDSVLSTRCYIITVNTAYKRKNKPDRRNEQNNTLLLILLTDVFWMNVKSGLHKAIILSLK